MYWQEDPTDASPTLPDDVVDLAFSIGSCQQLPLDHAWLLSETLQGVLPWLTSEPLAGVHLIHGAESGNGWQRPEASNDAVIYLTRRTRLVLRLPRTRLREANNLTGQTLLLGGYPLTLGTAVERPLSRHSVLYSRYLVSDPQADEGNFLTEAAQGLKQLGIRYKKMLAGRANQLATPAGPVATRSLMVAELPIDDAITLQRHGLGPRRTMGCGLFVAHKTLADTRSAE